MKLRVVIEKDETGYYVAEVPALPGCVSQGKTIQEARANIREAIAGWVAVMNKRALQSHSRTTHEVAVCSIRFRSRSILSWASAFSRSYSVKRISERKNSIRYRIS